MKALSWVMGALLLPMLTMAQPEWVVQIEPLSSGCGVLDVHASEEGQILVIVSELSGEARSRLLEFNSDGLLINEAGFNYFEQVAYGQKVLGKNDEGDWLILGQITQDQPLPVDSSRVVLFRTNEQLETLQTSVVGIPGKRISYLTATIAPDSTIRVAYQTFVDDTQPQQFQGLTLDLEGNELQSLTLLDVGAFPSIGSLDMLPNGNMLMTTTAAIWDLTTLTTGIMQQYDDSWDLLATHGLPMVDASTALAQNGPNWPLYTHVLPSGNVIASGHYWKCFCEDRGAVLQRATVAGEVLAQWTADSPYLQELPAWIKAIDVGPNGDLYYAQMNNWSTQGVNGTIPSQVELFRMDTSLNVHGRYLFDGFETNTYYYPSYVKATPDGGVLVGGSLVDLNVPGSLPQGWLAKFGPEDFVGVTEHAAPMALIFPNPGAQGFNLSLGKPLPNGRIELHDMQGRLVLTQSVYGINGFVATDGLASGLYAVSVHDPQGTIVHQQRWAKE